MKRARPDSQNDKKGQRYELYSEEEFLMASTIVNPIAVQKIDAEFMANGLLDFLLKKIVLRATQGGIKIMLRINNIETPLNEETQKFFDLRWLPEIRKMMLNRLMYGLSPTIYVQMETSDNKRFVVPKMPISGSWQIRFMIDDYGIMQYRLFKLFQSSADTSNRSKGPYATGLHASPQLTEWKNSRVFEFDAPSIQGHINSPVAKSLKYIDIYDNMWEHYERVSARLADPRVFLESAAIGKKAGAGSPGSIPLGDQDAGLDEEESYFRMDDLHQEQLEAARQSAEANTLGASKWNNHQQTAEQILIKQYGLNDAIPLPTGMRLAGNVPQPQLPQGYHQVMQDAVKIISQIIGVPEQMTAKSGARNFTASVNMDQSQFTHHVKSLQEEMIPAITTMFYDIYASDHLEFVQDVVYQEQERHGIAFDDSDLQKINSTVQIVPVFNFDPVAEMEKQEREQRAPRQAKPAAAPEQRTTGETATNPSGKEETGKSAAKDTKSAKATKVEASAQAPEEPPTKYRGVFASALEQPWSESNRGTGYYSMFALPDEFALAYKVRQEGIERDAANMQSIPDYSQLFSTTANDIGSLYSNDVEPEEDDNSSEGSKEDDNSPEGSKEDVEVQEKETASDSECKLPQVGEDTVDKEESAVIIEKEEDRAEDSGLSTSGHTGDLSEETATESPAATDALVAGPPKVHPVGV